MADYSGAIDYFVNENRVFVNQNTHSAIVVHGTGGSATQTVEELGEWFRTNANWVSSHYGVGRDGRIAQYVLEKDGAAANCCLESGYDSFWNQFGGDNLNVHTISVEHINDESNSLPLTDEQKEASFNLIAYLCKKYNLTSDQVKTHASIAPGSRARCPGSAFPLDELKAFLNGEGAMFLYKPGRGDFDQWFVANNENSWTCKQTGATLMFGNLSLFKTLSIDGYTLPIVGLPLENEQYHTDPDGYSWSSQKCERAMIVYDPEHKKGSQPGFGTSYLAHINYSSSGQIPDTVMADIKAVQVASARLAADAGQ